MRKGRKMIEREIESISELLKTDSVIVGSCDSVSSFDVSVLRRSLRSRCESFKMVRNVSLKRLCSLPLKGISSFVRISSEKFSNDSLVSFQSPLKPLFVLRKVGDKVVWNKLFPPYVDGFGIMERNVALLSGILTYFLNRIMLIVANLKFAIENNEFSQS